jgi:hypothetical protein
MDKQTAMIVRQQIVGEYSGHMSSIPFNPILHSIFGVLMGGEPRNFNEYDFAKALRQLADAIEQPSNTEKDGV